MELVPASKTTTVEVAEAEKKTPMIAMHTVPVRVEDLPSDSEEDVTAEEVAEAEKKNPEIAKVIRDAAAEMEKDFADVVTNMEVVGDSAQEESNNGDSDTEQEDSDDESSESDSPLDKKTQTEENKKKKKKKSGDNRAALRAARKILSELFRAWASKHNEGVEPTSVYYVPIRPDGWYKLENQNIDRIIRMVGEEFGERETLETLVNDNDLSENSITLKRRMAITNWLLQSKNVALATHYAELCSNENQLPINIFGHFKHVMPKATKRTTVQRGTLTFNVCESIINQVNVTQNLRDQNFLTDAQLAEITADIISKCVYPDGTKEGDKVYTIDEIREADDRFKAEKAARNLRRKQKRSATASPDNAAAKRTKI